MPEAMPEAATRQRGCDSTHLIDIGTLGTSALSHLFVLSFVNIIITPSDEIYALQVCCLSCHYE